MQKRRIFYGWWIVLAGLAIGGFSIATYSDGFSAFSVPLLVYFGWSRTATAGASSVSRFLGIIALLIIGPLIDRFGPRRVMLTGTVIATVGFVALSLVNSLWMLYLTYGVLLALGFKALYPLASQTAVANWFRKRRCLALTLVVLLSGMGGIAVPPIAWGIAQYGWRTAAIGLAVATLIICSLLSLVVRHKPEQHGYLPDGEILEAGKKTESLEAEFTIREALRTRAFWLLAIAVALGTGANGAVLVHMVPFLTDMGLSSTTAAAILGFVRLVGIPAMLLFGYLGDVRSKRHLLTVIMILQGIGLLILVTSGGLGQVYLFVAVYSFSAGLAPLLLAIRADYFGRKAFATIAAVMTVIIALMGVGGVMFSAFTGWIFDITGSYHLGFILLLLICFVAAALFFFAKPPKPPKRMEVSPSLRSQ